MASAKPIDQIWDESDPSDAELPWSNHGSDLDDNDDKDGESDGALPSDPDMVVSDPGLSGPSDVEKT